MRFNPYKYYFIRARKPNADNTTDENFTADEQPCSSYDLVTRTRLEGLAKDVEHIRNNVNAVLWTIAGAVVIDIVLRLISP